MSDESTTQELSHEHAEMVWFQTKGKQSKGNFQYFQ